MDWGPVLPTAAEDSPAPTYPSANVVTGTSGKGAVPANDKVSFYFFATPWSRAVAVF